MASASPIPCCWYVIHLRLLSSDIPDTQCPVILAEITCTCLEAVPCPTSYATTTVTPSRWPLSVFGSISSSSPQILNVPSAEAETTGFPSRVTTTSPMLWAWPERVSDGYLSRVPYLERLVAGGGHGSLTIGRNSDRVNRRFVVDQCLQNRPLFFQPGIE